MNLINQYEELANNGQWSEALPIIKEIIDKNSAIDTSWFNYGVCLDELGQHREAAKAFLKAHELNITDDGIHYRIFRSFYLDKDLDQTYEFVNYLCETFEETRENLFESSEYKDLMKYKPFRELQEKYSAPPKIMKTTRKPICYYLSALCNTIGLLIFIWLITFFKVRSEMQGMLDGLIELVTSFSFLTLGGFFIVIGLIRKERRNLVFYSNILCSITVAIIAIICNIID